VSAALLRCDSHSANFLSSAVIPFCLMRRAILFLNACGSSLPEKETNIPFNLLICVLSWSSVTAAGGFGGGAAAAPAMFGLSIPIIRRMLGVGGGCLSAGGIPRNGCVVTGFGCGLLLESDPITGGGEILCPEVLLSTGVLNTRFVNKRGTKSLTGVVTTVKGFSCSCVAWTGSLCRSG